MLDIYSAFGNSVRTKLILCLSEKPKNVTELINNCNLSQSAVSQHLSKLKMSGLVETSKKGKEIYYSLKTSKAGKVAEMLVSLEGEIK